jgi:hypothetical protein
MVHFGLGEADRTEIRIQWPDGETGPWLNGKAHHFWTNIGDASEAHAWEPD